MVRPGGKDRVRSAQGLWVPITVPTTRRILADYVPSLSASLDFKMRAQFNKKKREREQAARDAERGNTLDPAAAMPDAVSTSVEIHL